MIYNYYTLKKAVTGEVSWGTKAKTYISVPYLPLNISNL